MRYHLNESTAPEDGDPTCVNCTRDDAEYIEQFGVYACHRCHDEVCRQEMNTGKYDHIEPSQQWYAAPEKLSADFCDQVNCPVEKKDECVCCTPNDYFYEKYRHLIQD